MYIKSLKLKDFRNYHETELEFGKEINLIKGENAQGKTNLIEAIYLLGFARSFRTSKDTDLIYLEKDRALVSANIEDELVNNKINIEIRRDGKTVKCDGRKISRMKDLLDRFYVVIFSPEDLSLVKESPERRRNFIDRELSKIRPAYYETYIRYRNALKQRNTYLKEPEMVPELLDIWNEELALYGTALINKRKEFVDKLEKISGKIHNSITAGREELSIEYEANIKEDDDYISVLNDTLKKDTLTGSTSRGPHRDDIKICVNGADIRHFGSQGQQRTAALSLKLAEVIIIKEMTGKNPTLLLDDVLSELDISRQEYLLKSLEDVQMFITSADISDNLIDRIENKTVFEIKEGTVSIP